ncbi:MAG: amidohydrolase family protein [Acidobacteriia bacterium]|nr:amidohydrolase family protein [Terriglobia bacterium]
MLAEPRSLRLTRREALNILGLGAAAAVLPGAASGANSPQFPKGAIIRTILKDLPPEALAGGSTLFHEHMSLAEDFMPRWMSYARATNPQSGRRGAAPPPPAPATPPQPFFMQDPELMADEMRAAAKDGVSCIVDGGHPDMGRDLEFLKELSVKSGLPIVAGCGFYTQPFYPAEIATWSEDQIAQELIRQANSQPVGVFGEIGSWDEITDNERKVFRAVGKAHVATNLPIFTHTGIPGKSAMEQLDLLEGAGVKPQRIVIGHLGNLNDPKVEVHKAICKRGAFIGFDRQGGPGDARQVPMVVALIEAGYADNLMFSSDLSSEAQTKKGGGAGYGKTLTVWVPKLRQAGVSDEILHGITVDNPRRFLAFVPKKKRKA